VCRLIRHSRVRGFRPGHGAGSKHLNTEDPDMPNTSFLVAPDKRATPDAEQQQRNLEAFVQAIAADPDIQLMQDSGTGNARHLVVQAPAAAAASLKSRFQGRVIIEPNEPLQLFSGPEG